MQSIRQVGVVRSKIIDAKAKGRANKTLDFDVFGHSQMKGRWKVINVGSVLADV